MAAALGLAVFRYIAGEPSTPNHIMGCFAFAAPFFTAGVLATVAHNRGSSLLLVAVGAGLLPISLVSIVMWPILIPASLIAVHGLRDIEGRPDFRDVVVSSAVVVGMWGTFAMLLFHQDPATWQTPDGFPAGSSNIVTTTESLVTFAVLLAVTTAALVLPRKLQYETCLH